MEVTKTFILSVEQGANALREKARDIDGQPETSEDNSVASILRRAAEGYRQDADLLDGFATRAREEIGFYKE